MADGPMLPAASNEMFGRHQVDQPTQYTITRTLPDELLRHDISDDELATIAELKHDSTWEGMWAAIGLTFGTCPPALVALSNYLNEASPRQIAPIDLVQIVLFFAALGVAVVLGKIARRNICATRSIVGQVRERTNRVKGLYRGDYTRARGSSST